MVDGQIRPNKVIAENLLYALETVPRELFVPRQMQSIAYIDEDIPLGNGRYMPEPMVISRLLQEANIAKSDLVLDIGCATGYSTALIGHLASTVVGLEKDKTMADEADKLLHDLDICNAVVAHQPELRQGYAQQGPYNVIVINGSVPSVPQALKDQLAEGGRLVAVLSTKGHMGNAVLITRHGESFTTRVLFDAALPVLDGFEATKTFTF